MLSIQTVGGAELHRARSLVDSQCRSVRTEPAERARQLPSQRCQRISFYRSVEACYRPPCQCVNDKRSCHRDSGLIEQSERSFDSRPVKTGVSGLRPASCGIYALQDC